MRTALALALALLALVTVACSRSVTDEPTAGSSAAVSSAGFVGCRSSASECRWSCGENERGFRFLDPDRRCPGEADGPRDTGACVCGAAGEEPPPEPPPGHFIGCRPSAGECMNSCPTRQGSFVADWPACPEAGDPIDMHGGCFCR